MTSLSIVLFLLFCPCLTITLSTPEPPKKLHLCNYHPRSKKKSPNPHCCRHPKSEKNLQTLVLASKKWLVEQHLTQDASRSPHIHRSVTAAPEAGQSPTGGWSESNRGSRVERGGPWKVTMDHHLALWKKNPFLFLGIVEFTRYITILTTWQVFSDRLQPLHLGPSLFIVE